MLVTIHRLSELTGIHRETIRKRCGALIHDGVRSPKLESTAALPLIFGAEQVFRFDAEKARLTHHQANLAALEEADRCENLIPAAAVKAHWADLSAGIRSKLIKLPPRLAEAVQGRDTTQAAERAAMQIVREALTDISRSGSKEAPPGQPG